MRWPHPDTLVSISETAQLLGVSRKTLSEPIRRIKSGQNSGAKNGFVATAAGIFAKHAKGGVPKVSAKLLINALNIAPANISDAPPSKPKETRYRLGKREKNSLTSLSSAELYASFHEEATRVGARNNPNARRRLKAIIDALKDNEIPFPVPMIEGFNTERFRVFATLSDWIAQAGLFDYRLFVFLEGIGRPVDFPSAPKRKLSRARYAFLSLPEWLESMKQGILDEVAAAETAKIKKAIRPGRASKPLRR